MSFMIFTVRSHSAMPADGTNPPLVRMDGDSPDSSFTTILTMPSPFGVTISAAISSGATVWSILVAPAEYQNLCNCMRGMAPGGTCRLQISYVYVQGSPGYIIATRVDAQPSGAIRTLEAQVHEIATTTTEIRQILTHDVAGSVVSELKTLNGLVGQLVLRLPESQHPTHGHGNSDSPPHRLAGDGSREDAS